jgi:hypothetical protein
MSHCIVMSHFSRWQHPFHCTSGHIHATFKASLHGHVKLWVYKTCFTDRSRVDTLDSQVMWHANINWACVLFWKLCLDVFDTQTITSVVETWIKCHMYLTFYSSNMYIFFGTKNCVHAPLSSKFNLVCTCCEKMVKFFDILYNWVFFSGNLILALLAVVLVMIKIINANKTFTISMN